jgi:phage antirepressor YoqD-like protein
MNELALTESPSLRAQYADRVEVLDKVKALRLLPDDAHATVEMVAEYYEVPIETVKSTVKNNRAELSRNGHRVLRGQDARSIVDLASLSPSISQLALFTRRAILNVGQLLRDSDVAEAVRTALLDAGEKEIAQPAIPQNYPEALRAYADEVEAHQHTRQERDELLPMAEAYADLMEADGTFDWAAVAQIFSRITGGLGRNNFLALLRSDDVKVLKENNTPYQVKPLDRYFKVIPTKGGSKADPTTRVTPEGLDWLRKRLVKHFNHQPGLFAIGEIA